MSSIAESSVTPRPQSRGVCLRLTSLLVLILLWFAGPTLAGEAAPAAQDPALEARVNALAAELRCLVCQNQTIADSNAGLAVDLKNEIRDKMKQGESESQIVDFMVARYGDFVLYRPPFKLTTLFLWLGPMLLVLIGLAMLYRRLKAVSRHPQQDLSPADRERAARLLAADGKEAP
jgi:cytochrome c-type biogenesis protein CcmH/NrfF